MYPYDGKQAANVTLTQGQFDLAEDFLTSLGCLSPAASRCQYYTVELWYTDVIGLARACDDPHLTSLRGPFFAHNLALLLDTYGSGRHTT
jgi:hypothetical protein